MGRHARAIEAIERAVAGDPSRADYRAQLARCLSLVRRDEAALCAVEAALALEPGDALTLDTLGVVLSRAGAHARAAVLFERAVEAAPGNVGFLYNLASSLRFAGDFEAAERAFEHVVRLAPRHYPAHSALAEIGRRSPADNHIERLLRLLDGVGEDVDGELHLRQALAKEFEDLGDYAAAFRHLAAGRAKKRRTLHYSFADDAAVFECVERVCDERFVARAGPGEASDAPIFVVGMPRTGTTLVERILSSHSQVTSAGELQHFGLCVKRAAGTLSRRVLDPETVSAAAAADPRGLGAAYLEAARPATGETRRFVDKMPLNFFYVGFIRRALPNAKIVCLRRDPLDTCIANFRQLFAVDFPYYNYAYDLNDIAEYYAAFHRLMAHWRRVSPGSVLELRYEALVLDQVAETKRLLEFCGLGWEDACLDFHANPAPVATASAVQVRRPLYSDSIGRWKRYGRELEDVRVRLVAAGISVGEGD